MNQDSSSKAAIDDMAEPIVAVPSSGAKILRRKDTNDTGAAAGSNPAPSHGPSQAQDFMVFYGPPNDEALLIGNTLVEDAQLLFERMI